MRVGEVTAEAAPGVSDVEVYVRRQDDSLRLVGKFDNRQEAEEFSSLVRVSIADGDPWALRLLDVSAGALRG